jgi:RNA polymerase sigma-70 factor (ECF subfamily)
MTSTPDGAGAAADLDLLARLRAGDRAAFEHFYRDLAPGLKRYAASLVGSDAEDVLSEAWVQISRDIRTFEGDLDRLRGWAVRIVRNRAIDQLRYRDRRRTIALTVSEMQDRPSDDDTAELALSALGTEAAVRLICTLPREQAEAVLLRAVVGLTPAAIAEALGKTPAAVRVATHRGLRTLQQRLTEPDRTQLDRAES